MSKSSPNNLILEKISEKSLNHMQVFYNTKKVFLDLKNLAKKLVTVNKPLVEQVSKEIPFEFSETGEFDFKLKFASDVLLVTMHTNIFQFPREHPLMRTSYIKEDIKRSYCGMIYMYNFLGDSIKYNRTDDLGYLIARIFVNKELHFCVEGKRQIGFMYNNFPHEAIDTKSLKKVLETAIVYCVDFDLLTPPFDEVKVVTVGAMTEQNLINNLKTGKRLGFRYQADVDDNGN
ncbi:hypothetical protein EOM09_04315 [bacterium]|nr:hypothetical protein [bacterium]